MGGHVHDAGLAFVEPLNNREAEILRLIADGRTNQQIADELHLALTTVKWYNTQIFGKLGVKNRRQAVTQARQLGILDDTGDDGLLDRTVLPRPTAPFVGRQAELDALELLVRERTPLITLLGAGGMGKTTLALMLAHRLYSQFRDGACFVPLATIKSSSQIVTTVAEYLGFQFLSDAGPLQQQLFDFLAGQHLLLVLDNFEHLLDDAVLLSDLVQAAPHVALIVTSRERLNLAIETVFSLGGLPYPIEEDAAAAASAHQQDAMQLFIQTARRTLPDFEPDHTVMPHVIHVCRMVGGMPLAIELAAGWIGVLSVKEIAAEIRQGLDILETDMVDVPVRQRSVRATLDYTWARLTPAERMAFMKLAVLESGFDVTAAEAIAGANVRVLRKLVNRGLVDALPSGRHRVHELLHQYALEKLIAAGEFDSTRDRHARYYAEFLSGFFAGPQVYIRGPGLAKVERELDNVLTAWRHMTRTRMNDIIAVTVDRLGHYIHGSARYYEGQTWLGQGLAALRVAPPDSPVPPAVLGYVLAQFASIHMGTDTSKARSLALEAIELLEPLGPSLPLLRAYLTLADPFGFSMTDEAAQEVVLRKAHAVAALLDDSLYLADVVALTAMTKARHGHYEIARTLANEALHLVGDATAIDITGTAKYALALAHRKTGDYAIALRYLHENLEAIAEFGNVYDISTLNGEIACVYRDQGDLSNARKYMCEVIYVHFLHAEDWQTVGAVAGVATIWHLPLGYLERAVELLAFAYHHPLATICRRWARPELDRLAEMLDPREYERAYERGRSYNLADLVDDLLAEFSAEP